MEELKLDDGGIIDVHTRIKQMCKEARHRLNLSNQQISDAIMERYQIDFPINTINNFFSDRSKAPTVYTTGIICAVLGISFDAFFGIVTNHFTEEDNEFVKQLAALKVENRMLSHDNDTMKEYFTHVKKALPFYRTACIVLFCSFLALLAFSLWYFFTFDYPNLSYGLHTGM